MGISLNISLKDLLKWVEDCRKRKNKNDECSLVLGKKLMNAGLVDFHEKRLAINWNEWFGYIRNARIVNMMGNNLRTWISRNNFYEACTQAKKKWMHI